MQRVNAVTKNQESRFFCNRSTRVGSGFSKVSVCRVHRALLSEFGPQFMPPRLKDSEAFHEIEAIFDVCCGGALTTTDSKLLLHERLSFFGAGLQRYVV